MREFVQLRMLILQNLLRSGVDVVVERGQVMGGAHVHNLRENSRYIT